MAITLTDVFPTSDFPSAKIACPNFGLFVDTRAGPRVTDATFVKGFSRRSNGLDLQHPDRSPSFCDERKKEIHHQGAADGDRGTGTGLGRR